MIEFYFAHRRERCGAPVYVHASPSRRWVDLHGSNDPVVTLRVRERVASDPPSTYFGWVSDRHPDRYSMVYPSEKQFEICFPYGSSAPEKAGRGRKVNLHVEEVPTRAPDADAADGGNRG